MTKFATLAVVGTFAASLSACVQYTPLDTPPEPVTFTAAAARANVHKFSTVEIRTFVETGNIKAELSGATCAISGPAIKATVVSPARVSLPTYRGKTEDASVTCRTAEKTTAKRIPAINATLENLNSQTMPGGLAGALIGAAFVGIAKSTRDPLKDEYRYPFRVEIDMTPGGN